jgi:hypothetical protein
VSHLKIANERKGYRLTPLEREVIIGCLLGVGTVGHPELSNLYRAFYLGGIKSLPRLLGEYLTPLALAILFMDDGGRIHNTVSFALHGYSKTDAKLIESVLRKFGITSTWQSDGHGDGGRLYIVTSSYVAFKTLVKSYVEQVPCMTYKLP